METLTELAGDVRLDPDAFFRNSDGTWTVLTDTKILSGHSDRANTLLLPDGARIEERMFWANQIDLVEILDAKCSRTTEVETSTANSLERIITPDAVNMEIKSIVPVAVPTLESGRTLKVGLLLAAALLELGWVGGLGWMFFNIVAT